MKTERGTENKTESIGEMAEEYQCLYRKNQSLSNYTSMGVGGMCRMVIYPTDEDSLSSLIEYFDDLGIGWRCIGGGSNLIVKDEDINEVMIKLDRLKSAPVFREETVTVSGGYKMPKLVSKTAKQGLSGIEFLAGIPGTVGGGVVMNAGSYGKEIAGIIDRVLIMDKRGNRSWRTRNEIDFKYRNSGIGRNEIVLKAVFNLVKSSSRQVFSKVERLHNKRKQTQPLKEKTAGCIFKNPPEDSAGRIIENLNLGGKIYGGAKISELHKNFIINVGGASAKDVITLIEKVEDIVLKEKDIELEREVEVWG